MRMLHVRDKQASSICFSVVKFEDEMARLHAGSYFTLRFADAARFFTSRIAFSNAHSCQPSKTLTPASSATPGQCSCKPISYEVDRDA